MIQTHENIKILNTTFKICLELKTKGTNKVGKKNYKCVQVNFGCILMEQASYFLIICSYILLIAKFLRFFPLVIDVPYIFSSSRCKFLIRWFLIQIGLVGNFVKCSTPPQFSAIYRILSLAFRFRGHKTGQYNTVQLQVHNSWVKATS